MAVPEQQLQRSCEEEESLCRKGKVQREQSCGARRHGDAAERQGLRA